MPKKYQPAPFRKAAEGVSSGTISLKNRKNSKSEHLPTQQAPNSSRSPKNSPKLDFFDQKTASENIELVTHPEPNPNPAPNPQEAPNPQDVDAQLKLIADKWRDPNYQEDPSPGIDWKHQIMTRAKEGDVDGMITAALPHAQLQIISTALSATDPELRLKASQYIMGQGGKGEIKKVEQTNKYEEMPDDQLYAVIRSKMGRIAKLNPMFDPARILPGGPALRAENSAISQEVNGDAIEVVPSDQQRGGTDSVSADGTIS